MVKYVFLFFLLCALTFNGVAQHEMRIQLRDSETCNDVLRNVFAKVDGVPYGTLYNRVLGLSNLLEWQDGDTTSAAHVRQSWFDLEQSQNETFNFENNTNLNN